MQVEAGQSKLLLFETFFFFFPGRFIEELALLKMHSEFSMSCLRGVAGVINIHRGGVPRFKVILGGAGGSRPHQWQVLLRPILILLCYDQRQRTAPTDYSCMCVMVLSIAYLNIYS